MVMRFPVFVASEIEPEKLPSQRDTVLPVSEPFTKSMTRFGSVLPVISIVGDDTVWLEVVSTIIGAVESRVMPVEW